VPEYKLEFENERVRVSRVTYDAGEKSVWHSHAQYIAIFLTEAHIEFTCPDGQTKIRDLPPGAVNWFERTVHQLKNAGTKPFEVVLIELMA